MAPRPQPHRVTWPLTAEQADNIDQMFQMLFDDVRNGSIKIALSEINKAVVNPSTLFHIGDIPYADTTSHLTPLADVATGNAVISGGLDLAPSWGKIGLTTHVSGILPIANGGTSFASYTIGDILYASASGVLSKLVDVATGNAIISGGVGAAPSYGKIVLTTHISGTLPIANGGTNSSSLSGDTTFGGILYFDGTSVIADKTKLSFIGLNELRVGRASNESALSLTDSGGNVVKLKLDSGDNLLMQTEASGGSVYLGSKASGNTIGVVLQALGNNTIIVRSTRVMITGPLCLDGETSSFPSFKRSSAEMQVRLADDSAYAVLHCLDIKTEDAAFMHRSGTTLNNGAGASTGTLTNAPAATNPTKWIPIDDNGTTRYIPAW